MGKGGVVDANHHRIVVLKNPAQPAPPSEVENNLPIEMHCFKIELISRRPCTVKNKKLRKLKIARQLTAINF